MVHILFSVCSKSDNNEYITIKDESEVVVSKHGKNKHIRSVGGKVCMRFLVLHTKQQDKAKIQLKDRKVLLGCIEPHLLHFVLDLVVQLVRISACHAEGHEFESRLDRQLQTKYDISRII